MADAPAPKADDSKKQEASYCSVLGDGLCVPEQNEKTKEEIVKQNLTHELDKEVK